MSQSPEFDHHRAKRIEPLQVAPAHSLSKEQRHPVIPHHHRRERQERDISREERREERVDGDVECVAPLHAVLRHGGVGRGGGEEETVGDEVEERGDEEGGEEEVAWAGALALGDARVESRRGMRLGLRLLMAASSPRPPTQRQ